MAGGQREVRREFKIGSLRTESLYLAYVLWPVPMRDMWPIGYSHSCFLWDYHPEGNILYLVSYMDRTGFIPQKCVFLEAGS